MSPERKAVAEVGFSVIRSWHTPPGVRPDGTVDVDALRAWVTEARRLLAESRRTVPGDISIGGVLAYVPPDNDGMSPGSLSGSHRVLRSEHIETGLRTGKLNSRGMVWSSPTGGGVQERDLAAQFRGPSMPPTVGTGPQPSCASSQTTTTSGHDGRMIDLRTSGTQAPDPIARVGCGAVE